MKLSRSFIEINLAILFLSTSGVLGRLVEMQPAMVVWWRCVLAAAVLFIYITLRGQRLSLKRYGDKNVILFSGFLMGLHWVSYFYALQMSNVAIAMLTLHTYPAMTALLEPLILKTKFRFYHLVLSTMIVAGVAFLFPPGEIQSEFAIAIFIGLGSALCYALRNIYTRKVIPAYDGSVMMFYQLVIMAFLLTPFLFVHSFATLTHDWPYILMLALFTTCLGHTLFVHNLRNYKAVTISILTGIVPLYGILWAVIFLGEIPGVQTIIGGTLIMVGFLVESFRR